MSKLITLVAIVFTSLLPVGLSGQTASQTRNISGKVFDENGKPFPYVSVISSADSVRLKPLTGNVSSVDGSFVLKIPFKEYLFISFSFLGYETKTVKITNNLTDVGDIYMSLKPTELSEVVVRPIIEIYPDEIIYNITSDPERKTSNMLDIFSKIPGILTGGLTEDISLADNRKFIVLRNGRRDALFTFKHMKFRDVINKLPAMGFTQIKILFNPPLKYAKEFDVVIDVITDKSQRLYGAAASPYTTYQISFNKIETASGFVSSFDKIRISGSIGYSSEKSPSYYYKKINYLNENRQND